MRLRLTHRAKLLSRVRQFFSDKDVLEVSTPSIGRHTVTSPHIKSLELSVGGHAFYLQTSPEYALKRLLAGGSGAIYEIAKAFRDGESGERHNPEFTLLEWYRPGLDLQGLMEEADQLLASLCADFSVTRESATFVSYKMLFESRYQINPHQSGLDALLDIAVQQFPDLTQHFDEYVTIDDVLDLLFSAGIEENLREPHFVFNYPASQAALAKTGLYEGDRVAHRFEMFWQGMELANGYEELRDPVELRRRGELDNLIRSRHGLPMVAVDEGLLQAMIKMPECTGVAMGLDRIQMLLTQCKTIGEVINFPIE